MSFLPNEIFLDMTNFLPNNDITDLMLLSRKFNAFVTPRLQKIDQEMATMNQTIESLMPSPAPNFYDINLDLSCTNDGFVSANSRPSAARMMALSVPTRGLRPLERWLCQCQLAAYPLHTYLPSS
ncbi:hypothetical protein Ddc_03849 [Ditylenchus destructor]|nr:hypothetical protein Ddc_03849 [Ditylenchus destructor]